MDAFNNLSGQSINIPSALVMEFDFVHDIGAIVLQGDRKSCFH